MLLLLLLLLLLHLLLLCLPLLPLLLSLTAAAAKREVRLLGFGDAKKEAKVTELAASYLKAMPFRYILGLYWDNGKESGNDYNMLGLYGLYGDSGKANGNCYSGVI